MYLHKTSLTQKENFFLLQVSELTQVLQEKVTEIFSNF